MAGSGTFWPSGERGPLGSTAAAAAAAACIHCFQRTGGAGVVRLEFSENTKLRPECRRLRLSGDREVSAERLRRSGLRDRRKGNGEDRERDGRRLLTYSIQRRSKGSPDARQGNEPGPTIKLFVYRLLSLPVFLSSGGSHAIMPLITRLDVLVRARMLSSDSYSF